MWASWCSNMHNKVPTVPHDMDYDVAEEECRTQQSLALFNAENTRTDIKTKRRRTEEHTDIDVGRLGQNRFALLAGLEIENIPSTSGQVRVDTSSTDNIISQRKSFCPPIFLQNVNMKHLIKQLEEKTPKITFKVKNVSKYKSKLYFTDASVQAEMMALLREKEGVVSHTHTPNELKQLPLILRGLCDGSDAEELKATLDIAIPDVISKVTKYTTKYSIMKNIDTGLFMVTLLPGKKLTDVSHIKYVHNQVVIWEVPKKKEKEIQCRRCQRWGHVAKNCGSEFKCVKCNAKHGPGECTRTTTDKTEPHCVNCGEAGHPANWRGCPSYKNYQKSRKERINKAREIKEMAIHNTKKTTHSALISPGKTFANLFQPQHNQAAQQIGKPQIVIELLKLTSLYLIPEELSIEQEIEIFLNEHQKMPTNEARTRFLRLLQKVKTIYGP